ncbi:SDR family oxidoreductase [Flavobacterium selenitireducens]|uniref:SDR family oxidoreductase n=1 Tax=Flavobacterium selenitireducens TaxID=2722704 RepID=UPI00168A7D72|nr:SDR family oxidoreductase [Flavobacterium selenitireducens]MBD3581184.1 SDR family oxidoreductase [Flavobacterium selenitireducens]
MKTILITGASSGLGKAIGEYLFHKGYNVFGTSRHPEKVLNSPFPLLALDLNQPETIGRCVGKVIEIAGRIDVLVNNAGVGIMGPLEEIPGDEIRKHFETNLFGPVEVMKAVIPHMRRQGAGHIVNITSIAGYTGLPFRAAYSASKGALELLSEAIRMEVRPFGIKVCNLAPGEFATDIASRRYYTELSPASAYAEVYGRTLELINQQVSGGDDPVMVAYEIEKIINTPDPKIHYKVGPFLSKFSIVLKRILPDKTYEKMLMKHYRL